MYHLISRKLKKWLKIISSRSNKKSNLSIWSSTSIKFPHSQPINLSRISINAKNYLLLPINFCKWISLKLSKPSLLSLKQIQVPLSKYRNLLQSEKFVESCRHRQQGFQQTIKYHQIVATSWQIIHWKILNVHGGRFHPRSRTHPSGPRQQKKRLQFSGQIGRVQKHVIIPSYTSVSVSIPHFQWTTLEVGNQFLDPVHVSFMHISGSTFSMQICTALVSTEMSLAWTLELELSIPPWTHLNYIIFTILTLFSKPLWFFNLGFWVLTFVFNFLEYSFLAFDFTWPFSFTTRLKTGLNYAGVLFLSKSCMKAIL